LVHGGGGIVVHFILSSAPLDVGAHEDDGAHTGCTSNRNANNYAHPNAIVFICRIRARHDRRWRLHCALAVNLVVATLHALDGVVVRADARLSVVGLLSDGDLLSLEVESNHERSEEYLSEPDHIVVLEVVREQDIAVATGLIVDEVICVVHHIIHVVQLDEDRLEEFIHVVTCFIFGKAMQAFTV